jgi:hypothetical protein
LSRKVLNVASTVLYTTGCDTRAMKCRREGRSGRPRSRPSVQVDSAYLEHLFGYAIVITTTGTEAPISSDYGRDSPATERYSSTRGDRCPGGEWLVTSIITKTTRRGVALGRAWRGNPRSDHLRGYRGVIDISDSGGSRPRNGFGLRGEGATRIGNIDHPFFYSPEPSTGGQHDHT